MSVPAAPNDSGKNWWRESGTGVSNARKCGSSFEVKKRGWERFEIALRGPGRESLASTWRETRAERRPPSSERTRKGSPTEC